MESALAWAGIAVAIGVVIIQGAYARSGQRAMAKSQEKVSTAATDVSAGRLALDIALGTRAELSDFRTWQEEVQTWWNDEHVPWDEDIESELERLDPGAITRIRAKTPLPRLRRTNRPKETPNESFSG
jgi:hypothetical protein